MRERGLSRRAWTLARGVPLLTGILTLASVVLAVATTTQHSQNVRVLVVAGVLAAGALGRVPAHTGAR